ncbi:molybdopterin-guanine dinucleotide biosynthesis protein B [Paenibacillus rhizophilus]|uniref:Molybdopterin-guanine dinucleotide biosynthesis protein B n=1 Tax=Paenibacillus rhizophilus TaxID=1850366 RepID=A0A3N9Q735_9BACL|nr:molybdopterin-guanine dinucleotide biosynthesis protein B [Paenibacillus rhizophilus]RQW13326.1 molybdopterin-guanine dinucleotide biosynthesis protein B [Paenibacillus rhizophilus]
MPASAALAGFGADADSRSGRNGRRGTTSSRPAVCQFVGYKNSGKTTLICGLIPLLRAKGCSVAVIKHDAHEFEADRPETDTWRHREAGAGAVAITGAEQSFILESRSRELADLIKGFIRYDYVLVEGFKEEKYPKIVLIRDEGDLELTERLEEVAAVAAWGNVPEAMLERLPARQRRFGINDTDEIADYLWRERYFFQHFNI